MALTGMTNCLLAPDYLRVQMRIKMNRVSKRSEMGWSFHLASERKKAFSRLDRKQGCKSQRSADPRLPARLTSLCTRRTHRAADAGDVVVVQRRPAGVCVAVGGAPYIRVSGQNTPVHETEREETSYNPPMDHQGFQEL